MSRNALLFGTTQYTDPALSCLSAPAADLEQLKDALLSDKIGGFDAATLILNEPSHTVRQKLELFFGNCASGDLSLVYFSGHGILDDRGGLHLAANDTAHSTLLSTTIGATFVRELMEHRCPSTRQVIILDCCYSGAFGRSKGASRTHVSNDSLVAGTGRIVLTASNATQLAFEGDSIIEGAELSLFTHFLVEGLLTGDADMDGDGDISVDELYAYAHQRVTKTTSAQTPTKFAERQQGELIIARNQNPRARPELLPPEVVHGIESNASKMREAAIKTLGELLAGNHVGLALAAEQKLESLSHHDSKSISRLAADVLASAREGPPTIRGMASWPPPAAAASGQIAVPTSAPGAASAENPTPCEPETTSVAIKSATENGGACASGTASEAGQGSRGITGEAGVSEPPAKPPSTRRRERALLDDRTGIEWVHVAPGQHRLQSIACDRGRYGPSQQVVAIPDLWVGKFVVTNELYARFLEANPRIPEPPFWDHPGFDDSRQPVIGVSWHEANQYAEWAGARLPTDAEWRILSCVADERMHSRDELITVGWFDDNSGARLPQVGMRPANAFGIHDLFGSVWEWSGDWHWYWSPLYVRSLPQQTDKRIVQGGSWRTRLTAWKVKGSKPPAQRCDDVGFRVIRGLTTSQRWPGAEW